MVNDPWSIRAVQLDLARQREPIDAIERFIRFAADQGFNAVMLYLEGVIRTPSFPYRAQADSYSQQDIQQIVRVAGEAGVEVIPCVNALSHAEHFVNCDELRHLAAPTRPAVPIAHMFDPSNPQTMSFLSDYLTEVAALFESDHFHVGLDEAFQLTDRESMSALDQFIEHTLKLRALITGVGKRMWMWYDMLEFADQQQIDRLPRDIVIGLWQYNSVCIGNDGLQAQFNHRLRVDWLKRLNKMGFTCTVWPGANGLGNIAAMTRYARQHDVLGGVLAVWELGQSFLTGTLPVVAATGNLWKNPEKNEDEAVQTVAQWLLPNARQAGRDAIGMMVQEPLLPRQPFGAGAMLRGEVSVAERRAERAAAMVETVLASELETLPLGEAHDIVEDTILSAATQRQYTALREAFAPLLDPRTTDDVRDTNSRRVRTLIESLGRIAAQRTDQWQRMRAGLFPNRVEEAWRTSIESLNQLLKTVSAPGRSWTLVTLDFFSFDSFAWPDVAVELLSDSGAYHIHQGKISPLDMHDCFYSRQWLVDTNVAPTSLRVTVTGLVGVSLRYAQVIDSRRRYLPAAVACAEGNCRQPDAVLKDDHHVAHLGSTDPAGAWKRFEDHAKSIIELELRPEMP